MYSDCLLVTTESPAKTDKTDRDVVWWYGLVVLGLIGILCAIICPLILTLELCRGPIKD